MAIVRDMLHPPLLAAAAGDRREETDDDERRESRAIREAEAARRARLTALYAERGPRIHRFLRDLLGDPGLAADATQETFTRAFAQLHQFREDAEIAPWIYGIARNVSLEMRKARSRGDRHIVAGDPPDVAAPGCPEASYLGREALRLVEGVLAELPEERRAILLLRLDHGLSYDDIAITMSLSVAKVKVEIWRAREILRERMDRAKSRGER